MVTTGIKLVLYILKGNKMVKNKFWKLMSINKYVKGMKFSFIIFFLMGICVTVSAQQDPMFTQYMHNPVSINPAYAGSRGTLNIVGMHRQQWVGIDGAPKTLALSVNSPFIKYNVGIGLTLLYDQIGPTKQTSLFGDYSYHLKIKNKTKLALGLKGGVNVLEKDLANLLHHEDDEYLSMNGYQKLYLPNFGVGTYLYSDRYYLGLSIPKLLQNSLSDDSNQFNKEKTHYFISGGVVVGIVDGIKFKPSSTLRIVKGSPVSTELSLAVLLQDKLWFGAMYRIEDALGGMVKIDISKELSIGYSYDYTLSKLGVYSQGTHEIFISFDFIQKGRKILSPRYF
jgi:type IX secretion system PorP/SprF family membrane protein